MSDKVKLPKYTADAIELMRAKGLTNNIIVERHVREDHIRVNYYEHVEELPTDTLIRALYIGYEVEQTPEDKVRELYDSIKQNRNEVPYPQKACEYNEAMSAVRKTLDLLGIKISGVNAE